MGRFTHVWNAVTHVSWPNPGCFVFQKIAWKEATGYRHAHANKAQGQEKKTGLLPTSRPTGSQPTHTGRRDSQANDSADAGKWSAASSARPACSCAISSKG